MSFGLRIYDKDGKVTLDTSSFTVRLVTQMRINLGWMSWNQVSSVAVPEARAGMFAILTPMHSYDGITTLQSSTERGWVNPRIPVSTPYVQVYNGYVEIRAHGVKPNGYLEDYHYMHPVYVNERKYVNERRQVNKPTYKNVPERRQVCEWKNVWKYVPSLGKYDYVREYVCEMKMVDNWKWVDNWVWEDNWVWKDNWVWRDEERLHLKTGLTSRTSGDVMLYLFTNH